eukprot:jgi/Chlat1/8031/Chrsp71S00599
MLDMPPEALPASPPDTTVDAAHVIGLIRRLLPADSSGGGGGGEPKGGGAGGAQREGDDDGDEAAKIEAGCVLWDLSASDQHARMLVAYHLPSILLGLLQTSHSDRLHEISLGILANFMCHIKPAQAVSNQPGLIPAVINALDSNDPPVLTETCRLLDDALRNEAVVSMWVPALSEDCMTRLMWIADNTLHQPLLVKSWCVLQALISPPACQPGQVPAFLSIEVPKSIYSTVHVQLSTSQARFDAAQLALQTLALLAWHEAEARSLAQDTQLLQLLCDIVNQRFPALEEADALPSILGWALVSMASIVEESRDACRLVASDTTMLDALINGVRSPDLGAEAIDAAHAVISRVLRALCEVDLLDASTLKAVLRVVEFALKEDADSSQQVLPYATAILQTWLAHAGPNSSDYSLVSKLLEKLTVT